VGSICKANNIAYRREELGDTSGGDGAPVCSRPDPLRTHRGSSQIPLIKFSPPPPGTVCSVFCIPGPLYAHKRDMYENLVAGKEGVPGTANGKRAGKCSAHDADFTVRVLRYALCACLVGRSCSRYVASWGLWRLRWPACHDCVRAPAFGPPRSATACLLGVFQDP